MGRPNEDTVKLTEHMICYYIAREGPSWLQWFEQQSREDKQQILYDYAQKDGCLTFIVSSSISSINRAIANIRQKLAKS